MEICFVGYDFHRKTRSNSFFVDLLRRVGSVTELYSSPDGDPFGDDALVGRLMQGGFDRYIFWQTELIAERLIARDLGMSFLVPTVDPVAGKTPNYWLRFVKHRFLSFSRAHHEALQRLGCLTDYFQFYPDPGPVPDRATEESTNGFFWERQPRSRVNLRCVLAQCRALGIRHLHVYAAADSPEDTKLHLPGALDGVELSISARFESRAAFDVAASAPLFYFAPSEREGIGMATLEALARGQIVVAADHSIASEYLAHRTTGLLYDPEGTAAASQLTRPDDAALARMSRAARRKAEEGRVLWEKDIDRLLSIVADDGRRWSTRDQSATFVRQIRRAAHDRSRDAR